MRCNKVGGVLQQIVSGIQCRNKRCQRGILWHLDNIVGNFSAKIFDPHTLIGTDFPADKIQGLDAVGAFIDLGDAGIADELLHAVLADVAVAAEHLLRLLAPDAVLPAIAVLDHRDEPLEPLWAPERIEAALAQVGDAPDVLLWVVGLQDHYLAGSKARSVKARQAYDEAVECVNAYAARVQGRGRLTVVVL